MAIRRGSKVNSAFSSASMTDLMFLLLVFMLIATTLINPNALKLTLPTSNNQIKEKPYTTVSITSDLQYYVETVPVRFDDLETILRGKLEGAEQPTLSLHADKSVPIDNVVKVMNIAKDALGYVAIMILMAVAVALIPDLSLAFSRLVS